MGRQSYGERCKPAGLENGQAGTVFLLKSCREAGRDPSLREEMEVGAQVCAKSTANS